jgi:outer membrane protein assembly factor BamA
VSEADVGPGRAARQDGRRGGQRLALAAVLALIVAAVPVLPAPAAEPAGAAAADAAAPEIPGALAFKGWTTSRLEVRGAPEGLAAPLRAGLALAGEKHLLGTRRAVFFPRTLAQDIQRARLFLARQGYPHARCGAEFAVDDPRRREVAVTLVVAPGPPVRIADVRLEGLPAGFTRRDGDRPLLAPGNVVRDEAILEAAERLETDLREAGYAFARVEPALSPVDSLRTVLHLHAEPGPRVRFGEVRVAGVPDDLVPLVRKTVAVRRGALFSPAPLRQGQESLRQLGLFRQVRLAPQLAAGDTVDVAADLLPRKPRLWEASIGYWTDDFLKGRARWVHRNLLREGRGLEVQASASRFRQEGGTVFWWPALLGARTRVSAALNVRAENEDSYELSGRSLELAASWRPTLHTAVRAGVALEDVNVDPAAVAAGAFKEEGGLLTVFTLRWERDSVDDRISPARGAFISAGLEWSPAGFLSDSHFILLRSRATRYWTLTDDVVAATRLDLGWARPLGESIDLLPDRRFFAGGSSSMRGAKRRRLGPRDAAGSPVGGEVSALATAELRVPLVWKLRAALFADTGQVWARRGDVDLAELEVAVGPGLMVTTPVGPIRADFGYNLTDRPAGEPRTVLHLGIGHPF